MAIGDKVVYNAAGGGGSGSGAGLPVLYYGTGNKNPSLYIEHGLSNADFTTPSTVNPDFAPVGLNVTYLADTANIQDPYDLTNLGLFSRLQYGSNSVNARGTAHARTTLVDIQGAGSPNNEYAFDMGWMRSGSNTKPDAPGRYWYTDWSLHGGIGKQVDLLNGVTMFIGNYYNGQPLKGRSGAYWAVSKPRGGGGSEAGHNTATLYETGVGFGVVGFGSGTNNAFKVGFGVGGAGSGWMSDDMRSRIGIGLSVADVTDAGIQFGNPYAGGQGIRFDASAEKWNWLFRADAANTAGALLLPADFVAGTVQWGADAGKVSLARAAAGTLNVNGLLRAEGELYSASVLRGAGVASTRAIIIATDQGDTTCTLPPANGSANVGGGRLFTFTHAIGSRAATILPASGDNLGAFGASYTIQPGACITFMSDGNTGWYRVG